LLTIRFEDQLMEVNQSLANNKKINLTKEIRIDKDSRLTAPYWLLENGSLGMYKVPETNLIGTPESQPLYSTFSLRINKEPIDLTIPVVRRYSKPDKGELYEPFQVLPMVSSSIVEKVLIFDSDKTKEVKVKVRANAPNVAGEISLNHPRMWSVSPESIPISIPQKGGEITVTFKVTPPKDQSEGHLMSEVRVNGKTYTKELKEISYDHIPKQSVLLPSTAKVVRLNLEKRGQRIGYIQGAGDQIPESLRQIGYTVIELDQAEVNADNLQGFDAVILGIRAYNVNERAKYYQKDLHDYVYNGGTLLVQYNTSRRQVVDKVAPFELGLSRDRVTDENSQVAILQPKHELMSYPNKITTKDFEGWVQERGLYFPNKWSAEFDALLAMNDPGEDPKKGSLLMAKHGEGHFIYTGLSFFRELPAGVPGAYRLFTNLLSVGKNDLNEPLKN